MIHIVYPDDRWLSDEYVFHRHADAIANGELAAPSNPQTAMEAARELETTGLLALHKEQTKGVIVEDVARKAGVPVVKSPPVFVDPDDYKGFPFTPASPGVQKAAMDMIKPKDQDSVSDVLGHVAPRFKDLIDLEVTTEDWLEWARKDSKLKEFLEISQKHDECIAELLHKPLYESGWTNLLKRLL